MKDLASSNCLDPFQSMRLGKWTMNDVKVSRERLTLLLFTDLILSVKDLGVSCDSNDWNLSPKATKDISIFGTLPVPPEIMNSLKQV